MVNNKRRERYCFALACCVQWQRGKCTVRIRTEERSQPAIYLVDKLFKSFTSCSHQTWPWPFVHFVHLESEWHNHKIILQLTSTKRNLCGSANPGYLVELPVLCHWLNMTTGHPLYICTAQVVLNASVTYMYGSNSVGAVRNLLGID